GQIADLGQMADALDAAVIARGGRIVRERAQLAEQAGRVVIAGHACDQVLVAAGVRSAALMQSLGVAVPMIAERGYHIRAAAERWPADLPPV
nr:hypothetical protein [Tanacetum cinerariifolium]